MPSPIDVRAPLSAADVAALCAQLDQRSRWRRTRVCCDVSSIPVDAACVDHLARLALAVRRSGGQLRLRNASDSLTALIDLMGLAGVLRR